MAPLKTLHQWPFLGRSRPVEVASAEGAYLFQPDGKPILDAGGRTIVVNVGHGRAEVADVIREAAFNSSYVVPTWMTPERQAQIDELTDHWLPAHLSRIHPASGGSKANEAALKIAVQYQAARGTP